MYHLTGGSIESSGINGVGDDPDVYDVARVLQRPQFISAEPSSLGNGS